MLDQALRKAKWRQRLMMVLIAVIVLLVLAPLGYGAFNQLSSRQTSALYQELADYHNVAEPNVSVASEMLDNNSSLGGNVVTKEYKEIDGYVVPWGTYTSHYSFYHYQMDESFVQTVSNRLDQNIAKQQFQNSTLQKVARFYRTTQGLPNEAQKLDQLPNHVGEIAVTFKRPLTYAELKQWLPKQVNLTWGYLFNDTNRSGAGDETNIAENPIGMDLRYDTTPNSQLKTWRQALTRYWGKAPRTSAMTRTLKASAKTLQFRGVILTGTTEQLAKVAGASNVAGTSVGVTVARVPYIKPIK
ncbi:sigma factor regulator N-terminal domain-containing protein [Lacticaseibacillus suibinensis]|uniref:sigma factor regulator N-terminal domain-containing protein n=1 Tax=Lacticaseibacillus suibinensis TaxID=2486011 RepID=UPI000F76DD43|nr:sigma factor regulator N-terminal domain-containing protein [Lacticaseibacillus suibinensis]